MKEVNFKGHNCVIKSSKYTNNDNLALVLLDNESGELIAHVTVNSDKKFPSDVAILKDYSENEGLLDVIIESGLIVEVLGSVPLGYVTAPVVKFKLDGIEEM